MTRLLHRALALAALLDRLQAPALLALRLYVAQVFLRSGLLKLADWNATLALFHDEYAVPLLPPDVAAVAGTCGELGFSVLVAFGLCARLGAAGLFAVNAMAVASYPQLFGFECPAALNSHVAWGAILLALVLFGPGGLSLDALALRRLGMTPAPLNRR